MTRSILRIVLTTLALVMLFAGSLNLNRTSANQGGQGGGGLCPAVGCPGGPNPCATIILPDGTQINCGMP
ncbi:MAG TPA: hypothetical protein VI306_04050 [Pyrinomonadaceae bacterium]